MATTRRHQSEQHPARFYAAQHIGAAYSFNRTAATWIQEAYVKASNTGVGDAFGYALAFDDNSGTLAVSAVLEASAATGIGGDQSDDSAPQSGAVYLY